MSSNANPKPRHRGGETLSGFAYVDKDGKGHLPLYRDGKLDAAMVRDALARFDQTDFADESAKYRAWDTLNGAAKKLGIKVSADPLKRSKPNSDEAASPADKTPFVKAPDFKDTAAANAIAFNQAAAPDLNGVPGWLLLIPAGVVTTRDGRGPFVLKDAEAVVAATLAQQLESGLPIDINHATDFAAPNGGEAPAVGWIKELQVRDGAIWGRVEWNAKGEKLVAHKEYRYISPVFNFDRKNGEITQLLRAGLTNNPNLYFTAICSGMQQMKERIKTQVGESLKVAKVAAAAKIIARSVKLFAGSANEVAAPAPGTPVEQAYEILKAAAESAGIELADFIDAVVELAADNLETPDQQADPSDNIDGDDTPGADDLPDAGARVATKVPAAKEISGAKKTSSGKKNSMTSGKAAHDFDRPRRVPGEGDLPVEDEDSPESFDAIAERCEQQGYDDDAARCRHIAKKMRAARDEEMRARHRNDSAAAPQFRELTEQIRKQGELIARMAQRESRAIAIGKVEYAIREGRIQPSEREEQIELCIADPARFDKLLGSRVVLIGKGEGHFEGAAQARVGEMILTAAQLEICRNTGITPAQFAAQYQANQERRPLMLG